MEHDRDNFLSFWAISLSPYLQKMKKMPGDIIILPNCSKNHYHIIWYTIPEIWHVTDVIFIFYFGLIFATLPS